MQEFTDQELNLVISLVFQGHMELIQGELNQVMTNNELSRSFTDRVTYSRTVFTKLCAEKARRTRRDIDDLASGEHICNGAPADCVVCNPILGPEG